MHGGDGHRDEMMMTMCILAVARAYKLLILMKWYMLTPHVMVTLRS
jgi:hypothetical protein